MAAPTVSQDDASFDATEKEALMAEIFGSPVPDLHLTLWDLFLAAVASHPDRDAIVSLWQPCDGTPGQAPNGSHVSCLRWSYTQLKEKTECLAESLQSLGCRPGMRLAVVLGNSAEWGLFFWVAAKLQMTFVPIDATVSQDAEATIISIRPHVVVAQDAEGAVALDFAETHLAEPSLRILCTGEHVDGWLKLCDVSALKENQTDLAPDAIEITPNGAATEETCEQAALIVFTSGTTGEPKGCWHTNRNLVSQCCDFDPEVNAMGPLRWLVHTPVSHIFAINNSLRAWRWGGTAVFPSKTFNVDATLKALVQEQCSIMSATPTLVKALMAHPSFPSVDQLDLRIVTIGGTSIGPEDIRLCREGLGAESAIQVYGMSEGAPVVTWGRTDPDLVDGWHPGVGKVLPGAAARICRPGTHEMLRRSEIGELHIGGTSVITRYLSRDHDDAMYQDETGPWLATGDQAKIDEKGIVYILGRYKDLIIRGGENIYPVKIEQKLQELDGLQVQVVGVPDDLAGQVPVAIVILPKGLTKAQVSEKARSINAKYALDDVYTLQELGLDKFPVTALGKVKKQELKMRVLKLRQASRSEEPQLIKKDPIHSIVEKLLSIWEKLSGTRPDITESVKYLADSITLLRYCDNVLRVCGQRLYLQDFAENDTVEKQAHLLITRQMQQARIEIASQAPKIVPLLPMKPILQTQQSLVPKRDQFTLSRDTNMLDSARRAVISAGLQISDIEDVLAIRDSLHRTAIGPRPQSYHNRMVFRVGNVAQQQIRRALEKALASRPMLRTLVFPASNGAPFHAVLSSSAALFDRLIHEAGVNTDEEAWTLFKDDTAKSHSSPFMFQADMIRVSTEDQLYLSFTFNHSVIDALSLTQWHHELDRWIQDINVDIPALTPYRLFSDLFSQYEESEPAQKSVAFHVKRLRGISRFNRALWPPQRAPGMMICNDRDSPHAQERRQIRDKVWAGQWEKRAHEFQYPRTGRIVGLPGLAALRDKHGVEPSLFAKSAIVLFNVLQTGSSHALLNVWESGRSWPFIPSWMEKLLPPAMSIDGPTVQWILDMAEVVRNETLIEFLQRMSIEQEQIKQHEHVPWNKVVQALRDEGDAAIEASFRQAFVWDVSMAMSLARGDQTDFTTLQPVARYDWPDCGLFWNAFMIDSFNLYFIASWDTAQMNDVEVDGHCDSLSDVMRKLADETNWDKKLSEVFTL